MGQVRRQKPSSSQGDRFMERRADSWLGEDPALQGPPPECNELLNECHEGLRGRCPESREGPVWMP